MTWRATSAWPHWEAKQLIASGVLSVEDYPQYDAENDGLLAYEEEVGLARLRYAMSPPRRSHSSRFEPSFVEFSAALCPGDRIHDVYRYPMVLI